MRKPVLYDDNEVLIWHGKKAKTTSVLDAITNAGVLAAMIVVLVDILILALVFLRYGPKSVIVYLYRLVWLHFIPVLIYIVGVVVSILRSASTDYIITNKYVYIQYGLFKRTIVANDVDDIEFVSVRKNVFDRIGRTADISVFTQDEIEKNGRLVPEEKCLEFENIREYEKVYDLIEKIRSRTCSINDPEWLKTLN